MKIWNILLRLSGLVFLLLGSFLSVRDGLLMDWWQLADLLLICTAAAVFVTLMDSHWITALIGNAAGGIGAFYLVRQYGEEIAKEWQHILDAAAPLINEYHHLGLPAGERNWERLAYDSRPALVLAALALGLLMGLGLAVKKLRLLAYVPVAAAFASGLAVGNAPGVWAVICLVVGLGICHAIPGKRTDPVVFKTSVLTLVGLFFVLWIVAAAYQPLSQSLLKNHDRYLKRQIELEDELLALTRGGQFLERIRWRFGETADQAVLSTEAPRQGDAVVFELTVEELPEEPVYVKNFTSARYKDGIWQAEEGETYASFLKEQGFVTDEEGERQLLEETAALELTRSYRRIQKGELKPQRIVMNIKERTGNTTLWPYFCALPADAEAVGDAGIRTASGRYEIYGYLLGVGQLEPYCYPYSVLSAGSGAAPEERVEDTAYPGEVYNDFLSEQSRRMDTPVHRLFEEDPGRAFDALGECSYSFDLEPVPEGSDVVEDFLFRQKKGYCMHFASAQTLIWQSISIPARYASGYVVLPGDFVKNADGAYTAAVPQYRGHAWMEVYSPFFGWYPLEVTPPSYLNTLERAGTGTAPGELYGARQPEERQEEPDAPDAAPKEPEDETAEDLPKEEPKDTEKPEEDSKKETVSGERPKGEGRSNGVWAQVWPVLAWCIGGILLLAALYGLNLLRIRRIWRRRWNAFTDGDSNRAAVALSGALLGLLRIHRIRMEPGEGELVFAGQVEEALSWMEPGQFAGAVETIRAARFGKDPIGPDAHRELLKLYGQMMDETLRQMDQKSRIWYGFFHIKVQI